MPLPVIAPWLPIGSGGGDKRPPTRDGRRPGCEDERLRPTLIGAGAPGKDVAFACGTEPTEVVDSVGEDDRVLGGAEVFVLR